MQFLTIIIKSTCYLMFCKHYSFLVWSFCIWIEFNLLATSSLSVSSAIILFLCSTGWISLMAAVVNWFLLLHKHRTTYKKKVKSIGNFTLTVPTIIIKFVLCNEDVAPTINLQLTQLYLITIINKDLLLVSHLLTNFFGSYHLVFYICSAGWILPN